MSDFDFAAHVSYVLHRGTWLPWHVVFTSTTPPFYAYTIGLKDRGYRFSNDEIQLNMYMDVFPRPPTTCLEACVKVEEFPTVIQLFMKDQTDNGSNGMIGAVDAATYDYLKGILPNVMLLEPNLKGEDLTMAAAVRKHAQNVVGVRQN